MARSSRFAIHQQLTAYRLTTDSYDTITIRFFVGLSDAYESGAAAVASWLGSTLLEMIWGRATKEDSVRGV